MFNETRLLDCVAYGSEFGQEFSTRITSLRSGVERRNANWSMPLGRYSVLYGSIATVIVVLLWLYMSGQVLILGAEFSAALLDEKRAGGAKEDI